jgi:hypothetical protein
VWLRGGHLTVTGIGALTLPVHPDRTPIRVDALELDDVVLELMATGYWPGLARVVITIEHAHSGPTVLRTGLSWLLTLDELVARVDLPAGLMIRLSYRGGEMAASGAFFGGVPLAIPFRWPARGAGSEAHQLVAGGKDLLERLALERARRWLERHLH